MQFDRYEPYDNTIQYCVPLRISGNRPFNLLAVWAMGHVERSKSYIGQVYRAVEVYGNFLQEQDTMLAGDLNSNSSFYPMRPNGNHNQVVDLLQNKGIVSAYHRYHHEAQGGESQNTQYMNRDESRGFHLDYCFVPESWMPRVKSFQVGSYADWHELSDHCPIFAEFDLQ